jgi:hypothetical protein
VFEPKQPPVPSPRQQRHFQCNGTGDVGACEHRHTEPGGSGQQLGEPPAALLQSLAALGCYFRGAKRAMRAPIVGVQSSAAGRHLVDGRLVEPETVLDRVNASVRFP